MGIERRALGQQPGGPRVGSGTVAVGVDIGGTKIATGLVSGSGQVLASASRPTPARSRAALLQAIAGSVDEAMQAVEPEMSLAGIGIGVPAVVDRHGRSVEWAPNVPALDGVPLGDLVEEATGMRTALGYDGHAAALAEHWIGAARGASDAIVIIVGTGVGGGVIAGGRLIRGAHGLAGAFGWFSTRSTGGRDRRHGGLERVVSGPAILRAARRKGTFQSTADVFTRAEEGDAAALDVLTAVAETLGGAVADLVSAFDPEVVVLAGGVGARAGFLLPRVREATRIHAQPWAGRHVRVCLASSGPRAGLIGAARFVLAPGMVASEEVVGE